MTYEVPVAPGESADIETTADVSGDSWPMWEVFVRARRGISHVHIGSLHAPDGETALENARDVYTRRGEGVSVWVVPSSELTVTVSVSVSPVFSASTVALALSSV